MDVLLQGSVSNKNDRLRGRIGLVFLFTIYIVIFRYFCGLNPIFYWLFFLLIKPAVSSFILSFFFIESIDDRRIPQHKDIRFSFFIPFLKVGILFWMFLFVGLFIASIMLAGQEQKELYLDLGSNFIIILSYFWLTACIFEKNRLGKAFKSAVKTAVKYPAFYAGFFIFSFLDTVVFNRLMTEDNFLPILSFGFLFAMGYLMFYKMIVLKFARYGSLAQKQELVEGYFRQERVVEHDEKMELKEGRKCLILGIFSFFPFVHLVALFYSLKKMRRQKFARVRLIAGFILGVFFTTMYLFAFLGMIVPLKKTDLSYARTIDIYMKPNAASLPVQKALRKIKNGDYLGALDLLKKVNDGTEVVCFAKGVIYEKFGDIDQAIEMFSKSIKFDANNGEAYFHLGFLTMYKPDQAEKAKAYFKDFLASYPHDPKALKYIQLLNNGVNWASDIFVKIIMIVVLLISFVLHEFSHALTAYKCGDETQKSNRRLTLNPFAHLDLFGSIILPAVLLLRNSPVVFGWAKPVSFDRTKFKDPDRDEALVSLMGPAMNICVGLVATTVLVFMGFVLSRVFRGFVSLNYFTPFAITSIVGIPLAKFWIYVNIFFFEMAIMSLVLAVFNLLPIPPLDGSWLLPKYLPLRWQAKYEKLRKYSFIFILIIVLTPILDFVIGLPVMFYLGFLNLVLAAPFGLG